MDLGLYSIIGINIMDDPVGELIEKYGKGQQRTTEWFTARGEMLTASEIVKACVDATPAMKHEIIMSKLSPRSSEGSGARSLIWGTRFEQIAKDIYCSKNPGIQIVDTTCIPHPDYSFLGASPDGILRCFDTTHPLHNRLIEIKCPISRIVDGTISNQYMCQMQLQMECTRISKCEFVEMKFKELTYTEWVDSKAQYKSFFAVTDSGDVIYKHFNDARDVPTWRADIFTNMEDDHRIFYWEIVTIDQQTVNHDPNWLLKNIDSFKSIWETVVHHRSSGTFPLNPKEASILIL
jgi:putative phage-type endonuclease